MGFLDWVKAQVAKLTAKLDYLTGRKYVSALSCNVALYLFASAGHFEGIDPAVFAAMVAAPWVTVGAGQAWVDVKKAILGKAA